MVSEVMLKRISAGGSDAGIEPAPQRLEYSIRVLAGEIL
jgi:hypothetical protein